MTPAALRQLAAALRGPPTPGENLRAADALEAAAAELDAAADVRAAAEGVLASYDAGDGPCWPAIEALSEALGRGRDDEHARLLPDRPGKRGLDR